MPFLRAARLKKKLQPEPEPLDVVLTPVAEEEQQEPEEEFSLTQIEDLHRLIDIRTEEAERREQEETPHPAPVVEAEIIAEAAQEATSEETELEPEPSAEEITPEPQEEAQTVETKIEAGTQEPGAVPSPEAEQKQEEPSKPETAHEEVQPEEEPKNDTEEFTAEVQETVSEVTGGDSAEEVLPETETVTEDTAEPENEPAQEPEIIPENDSEASFDENTLLDEPAESETQTDSDTDESDSLTESVTDESPAEAPKSQKDYSGSQLNYDFTSGERYVDKVSTKTDFDRMLDELAAISKDLLSWQAEKFARDYAGKFSEGESSMAEARKYEAFLGGYITNAAMLLYDKGYRDAALKQLEQAISILQARKKLEDETTAIKSRVEEQNDSVDLSDILGLFGDG